MASDQHDPAPPKPAGSHEDTSAGEGPSVLVVEDDPQVRDMVRRMLESMQYAPRWASNGEEALEVLREGPPVSVLFTDVVLPGRMNGPELARQAVRMYPHLKVLYTSGYAEDALGSEGGDPPEAELLSKPYRRQALADALTRLVGSGAPDD